MDGLDQPSEADLPGEPLFKSSVAELLISVLPLLVIGHNLYETRATVGDQIWMFRADILVNKRLLEIVETCPSVV